MKYSNYFSTYIKHNGLPNMEPSKFSAMMNIVFLEGQMAGISKVSKEESGKGPHRYDKHLFVLKDKLDALTGRMDPEIVLRSFVER